MDKEEFQKALDEEMMKTPFADPGFELARALLHVMARRHGPEIVLEVRDEMIAKAERFEATGDEKDRLDAGAMREIAGAEFFDGILERLGQES